VKKRAALAVAVIALAFTAAVAPGCSSQKAAAPTSSAEPVASSTAAPGGYDPLAPARRATQGVDAYNGQIDQTQKAIEGAEGK
jgi:hypothetical protein